MLTFLTCQTPAGGFLRMTAFAGCAVALQAGIAVADTPLGPLPSYHGAVADALGGEQASFSAFSTTAGFARAAGLEQIDAQPDSDAVGETARSAIDEQNSLDADTASKMNGAIAAISSRETRASRGDATLPSFKHVKVKQRGEEWYCLTEALYFEARGESKAGQIAVAEVILNRVDSKRYPNTICNVVQQGQTRRNACQFSYNCDGRANTIGNRKVFDRLGKMAWGMMEGAKRKLTGGALYYHNTTVSPRWSRKLVRTGKIGRHIFYRRPVKLSRK